LYEKYTVRYGTGTGSIAGSSLSSTAATQQQQQHRWRQTAATPNTITIDYYHSLTDSDVMRCDGTNNKNNQQRRILPSIIFYQRLNLDMLRLRLRLRLRLQSIQNEHGGLHCVALRGWRIITIVIIIKTQLQLQSNDAQYNIYPLTYPIHLRDSYLRDSMIDHVSFLVSHASSQITPVTTIRTFRTVPSSYWISKSSIEYNDMDIDIDIDIDRNHSRAAATTRITSTTMLLLLLSRIVDLL